MTYADELYQQIAYMKPMVRAYAVFLFPKSCISCFVCREHALELNNPVPTEPFAFLKPTSSYIVEGQKIKVSFTCS